MSGEVKYTCLSLDCPERTGGKCNAAIKPTDDEIEKLNTACFWLIKACIDTNAENMAVKQQGVIFKGENIGDWEIIVRKL